MSNFNLLTMKKLTLITTIISSIFLFISCEEIEEGFESTELPNKNLSANGSANFAQVSNLTTFWMRKDHEPWNRGKAEIYAHIIGLDSNRQPLISTVSLPFADHDKTTYYINKKLIDWDANNYAGDYVSIVLTEADDEISSDPIFTTTYPEDRFINTPITLALSIITNDFIAEEGTGYGFNGKVVYSGADDIVDVFYNISRFRNYEVVGGSKDNVYITLNRRFD